MPMQTRKRTRGTMLVSTAVILCVVAFAAGLVGGTLAANHRASAPTPAAQPMNAASVQIQSPDSQPLRKAAMDDPSRAENWIRLGDACYDSGDPDGAIDAYERALALEPGNADVLTDMGTMYRTKGQPEKAVECYDRAVAIRPGHSNALFNKGVTLMNDMNAPAEALTAWKSILQSDPGFTVSGGMRLDEAISDIAMEAGHGLEHAGQLEAALEAYAVAMETAQEPVQALVHRASLLERMGRKSEALPLWRRALELDARAVDPQGAPVSGHIPPS